MFGKIFDSMYDGTIAVNWKAMVTFQQMIVLCDSNGHIDMTPPAISRRTGIPLDIIEEGIEFLILPDKYSRSTAHEGKRIIPIDDDRPWGWIIVNHQYYRDLASREDKKEKDRVRIAQKREQAKKEKELQTVDSNDVSQDVAECSAESQMSPMQDTNTYTLKDMSKKELLDDSFGIFWNGYPRKEGKKKAEAAFKKLSKKKQELAIKDSSSRFTNTDKQFIPLPATYINGERWEDELSGYDEFDPLEGAI